MRTFATRQTTREGRKDGRQDEDDGAELKERDRRSRGAEGDEHRRAPRAGERDSSEVRDQCLGLTWPRPRHYRSTLP